MEGPPSLARGVTGLKGFDVVSKPGEPPLRIGSGITGLINYIEGLSKAGRAYWSCVGVSLVGEEVCGPASLVDELTEG